MSWMHRQGAGKYSWHASMLTRSLAILGFVGVATLAGCSGSTSSEEKDTQADSSVSSSPSASQSTHPSVPENADWEVGLCFDSFVDQDDHFSPTRLECDGPHQSEVYAVTRLQGESFPQNLKAVAKDVCAKYAVDEFSVGFLEEQHADLTWVEPTLAQWADDERNLACIISFDDEVNEPLADLLKRELESVYLPNEWKAGSCVMPDSSGVLFKVDCSQPHAADIFGVHRLTPDEYSPNHPPPNVPDICNPFVDTSWFSPEMMEREGAGFTTIGPTKAQWADGQHNLACVITTKDLHRGSLVTG